MRMVKLPAEVMDALLRTLSGFPYRDVANVIAAAQQSMEIIETDEEPRVTNGTAAVTRKTKGPSNAQQP